MPMTNGPTFAQEQYAAALVEKLRAAQNIKAGHYGRALLACSDKLSMSRLIDEMKRLLDQIQEDD